MEKNPKNIKNGLTNKQIALIKESENIEWTHKGRGRFKKEKCSNRTSQNKF